jgi:hypothetical protein
VPKEVKAEKSAGTASPAVLSGTRFHPSTLWASRLLLVILVISFVAQVFSPLRLCTDCLVLLSMARSAAENTGFLDHGEKTVFPPGYPAMVASLIKAGLGHPWAIVALNGILCGVGLLCFYALAAKRLVQSSILALNLCSFFLLSWVVVKHFPLPLTDIAFFAVSMLCLYALDRAWHSTDPARYSYFLCAGWVLSIGSILVRRIGIALIPALIFTVIFHRRIRPWERLKKYSFVNSTLLIAACAAALFLVGWTATRTSTLSDYSIDQTPFLNRVVQILGFRVTEMGELFLNVPSYRIPAIPGHILLPLSGILLIALAAAGIVSRRRVLGPTEVFFVAYAAILFVWPYYDARFWLPVVPLLFAFAAVAVRHLIGIRPIQRLVVAYISVFALLGAGAIVYSSRITFAGAQFPERYGDDTLRATYCTVFQSCPGPVAESKIKPKALELLRTYR